ncbi:kinase-like protein [Armillaria solidipes]|uniref:Kinase-like protein n=1 Tax=Armillaria solidipes TaxID=1076256 RepID=A0A2H3AQM7_9AGAR|nr:kinase-like protein [Armillaria solidipes]
MRTLLETCLKLTRTHDCVPRCLMLRGFRKTGDRAFALGHFGELWRGEVEGVEVAVKQGRIFTSDNNVKKVLRQLRREAIIWKQCDHVNVLPFYGIYRDAAPSTYCLVSPFMVNRSLRQYMNKTDDPDRHRLALDITRGMNYLHTLSIVHGDLKGDNILITDDRRAVIADFGISFVMGGTTFATSSSSSPNGGTARWQAPEVLKGTSPKVSKLGKSRPVYRSGLHLSKMDEWKAMKDLNNEIQHTRSTVAQGPGLAELRNLLMEIRNTQVVFDGTIPWSGLNDPAVIIRVCTENEHPPRPRELAKTGFPDLWWKLMSQCWAHEPLDRPTLRGLMKSLHATGDTLLSLRKWDNPVLGRLRDPLVHDELIIPSGLPSFLDITPFHDITQH